MSREVPRLKNESPGALHGLDRATIAVVVAIALALIALLVHMTTRVPSTQGHLEGGARLAEPMPMPDVSLVDDRGTPFDRSRLAGHWSLLFFGYTSCPDVCPSVLQELSRTTTSWPVGTDVELPRVVLISVDPERDTPRRLGEYLSSFDPMFRGVTGRPSELSKLAEFVGAYYPPQSGESESEHRRMDHSSRLYLVDPLAELVAVLENPPDRESYLRLVRELRSSGR